jgi:hypothetical protein
MIDSIMATWVTESNAGVVEGVIEFSMGLLMDGDGITLEIGCSETTGVT